MENVDQILRQEARNARADTDVLDAEREQGEQNDNGFLFEPAENQRQRQIIDAAVELLGQRQRQLDRRIAVVALTDVDQARDAVDVAELLFVEAVFAASERQDNAVLRGAGGEFLVIAALALVAVAAADQEEMLDIALPDLVDHCRGGRHQCIATEADSDLVRYFVVRETGLGFCASDDFAEILALNVLHTGPADDAARKDTLGVLADIRVDQAVRSHHDGAGESGKFALLVLPGTAVIANQMLELVEFRVTVRGQHFAIGVDVDAGAFGLLKNGFEVAEVVAGNKNGLASDRFDVHFGWCGMAKFARLAAVEHFHYFVVQLTDGHRGGEQRAHVFRVGAQPGHDVVKFGGHGVIDLAEHARVFHVRGGAFQAVEAKQAQTQHILADRALAAIDRSNRRLRLQASGIGGQREGRGRAWRNGGNASGLAGGLVALTQLLAIRFGLTGVAGNPLGLEIHIGQRGEKCLRNKDIDCAIDNAEFTGFFCVERGALQGVDEQVLQIGNVGCLAAHALRKRAALAGGG